MALDRSGVPGAPARTSWYDRDLPAMWRVLENQEGDDHWRLVAGWRKASELTATHLRRLEQYRASLAEVWPPDRNAAAAAYVARLDFLIQNVRTTHEVAAANYSTLAATVGALAAARRDLKPLHDEYVAKSRALKDYADLAALNAAAEAPTVIGVAPAGAQDLERLNSRGRAIMYALSHTLVEAEAAIRQPPTYHARTGRYISDPDVYGPESTNKALPARRPTESYAGISSALHEGGPSSITTPSSAQGVVDTDRSVLPSYQRTGATATAHLPAPPQPHPGVLAAEPSNGTSRLISREGVIGAHAAHPSLETSPPRPGSRVNPVGGLIEGDQRKILGANHVAGNQPIVGALSGQPGERGRRTIDSKYAETHWDLPKGVPPVIAPTDANVNADPGPTIGLNR